MPKYERSREALPLGTGFGHKSHESASKTQSSPEILRAKKKRSGRQSDVVSELSLYCEILNHLYLCSACRAFNRTNSLPRITISDD
jgi:hypothetical protein